jgi:pimeloyl-ACP methyl ester carboxylesterase
MFRAMQRVNHRGVGLAYEEVGRGTLPIVLAHGWGCDRTSLKALACQLRQRHRVVLVDFRGFGDSDTPRPPYSMATFADDLHFLADYLRLERPVIVGHGMGGTIALEAAAARPDVWSHVVMLESLVVPPPMLIDGLRTLLDGVRRDEYRNVMRHFARSVAGPFIDDAEIEHVIATMASCKQDVLATTLESLLTHDTTAAAAGVRCPVLYVSSGLWYTDVDRLRVLCRQLCTAQLVGCGHYFPLEVPHMVAQLVERFLDTRHPDRSAVSSTVLANARQGGNMTDMGALRL